MALEGGYEMSDKYINPSGLAHYDEKIKEFIDGKDKLKGDTLYYNEEKSELQLKSGENVLSTVIIVGGSSGGSTIKVADVSGATVSSYKTTVSLKWTDPSNATLDSVTLAEWAGTLVVRKEGSAPQNKDDGVVVVDNTTKDAYSSTAFEDSGLEYGKTYYYRFFPYTTDGAYTSGTSVSVVPKKIQITTLPSQNGTVVYDGNLQTALFDNYDEEQLEVSDNTGTNAGTYTAKFTPKYDYCWSDGSVDAKEVEWVIDKADGFVELSETSVTLDKTTTSTTVTVLNASGEVEVSSNNTNALTASITDDVITLTSTGQNGDVIVTVTVSETDNYKSATENITVKCDLLEIKIVTWADGTYEEISAMLDAHYAGTIDVSDYWSVGDVKSVPLSAMSATGVGEAHRAQTVEYTIMDFNKDDLETPINGNTKAAISVSQVHCLMDEANATSPTSGSSNTENGYMNSTDTNSGGWTSSARRTWCNDVYYNALPDAFKSMVKPVKKLTSADAQSTTISTTVDKVFLLSEVEIYGTTTNSVAGEGSQYTYYETASNRYKNPKWSSSSNSCAYWQRSPWSSNSTYFVAVSSDGSAGCNGAGYAFGLAPCLCI